MCPRCSPGSSLLLGIQLLSSPSPLPGAAGAGRPAGARAKMARSGARWPRLLLLSLLALALPAAAERGPGPAGERGAGAGMRCGALGCGAGAGIRDAWVGMRGLGCADAGAGMRCGVGMRWPCPWKMCTVLAGPLCACRLGNIRREGNAGTRRLAGLFIYFPGSGGRRRRGSAPQVAVETNRSAQSVLTRP